MDVVTVKRWASTRTPEEVFGILLLLGLVVLGLDLIRRIAVGDVTIDRLSTYLWRGIVDGLLIGLAAIGLSMTYSILRFANFSHGDLVTTGAFTGWTVAYLIGGIGAADLSSRLLLRADGGAQPGALGMHILGEPLAIVVGLAAAAIATVLVALAIDRLVYRPMRDAGGIPLLISSVGVALVLRYLIAFIYRRDTRGVIASAPRFDHRWIFWTDSINLHQATMVVAAIILMLAVHVMLQYTKLGKAMRAMADNKDLALITGIPTERVVWATWVIGGGLAGVAGYLVILDRGTITFNLGWFLLLLIFSAVILGGIGSIYGAIVGALIIGISINVSIIWMPTDLNHAAAFGLMILVLIFRPQGLFTGVRTA